MNQFYAVNKKTNLLAHTAASLALIKARMQELGEKEEDFYILQDIDMKYISRVVYVDGECVYNNKDFWTKEAPTVLENFNEHEVKDFMSKAVDFYRFTTEYNSDRKSVV